MVTVMVTFSSKGTVNAVLNAFLRLLWLGLNTKYNLVHAIKFYYSVAAARKEKPLALYTVLPSPPSACAVQTLTRSFHRNV